MIAVTKLHPLFMAEIGGVDLTQPVSAVDYAAIVDAFNKHAVLIFREGFAIACPLTTLIVIVYIGLNKDRHLLHMKQDLEKVFINKQK